MTSRAKQQAITEDALTLFLSDESHSREWARLYIATLGSEGCELLKERIDRLNIDNSKGDQVLAKLLEIEPVDSSTEKMLEINTLFNYFQRRKSLLANSVGSAEAARLLNVSKQTIHDRIRDGKLIGIFESNVMQLPTFQFDAMGPNGVVKGLPEVIRELSGNILGKISWLTSPNGVFEGRTPIEILKDGNLDSVLREARSVGVD